MVVTIDLVTFRRRRDALRLLRDPSRHLESRPAFAKALLLAPTFRSLALRKVVLVAGWGGEPPALLPPPRAAARRGTFEVQRTHGTLGGSDPLGGTEAGASSGPGAIWTCGSVRLSRLSAFLLSNVRVVRELRRMPGLQEACGVMGFWRGGPWMCTLSFWDDLDAGLAFAYRSSPAHRAAIRAMRDGAFGTRESYFARLGRLDAGAAVVAA